MVKKKKRKQKRIHPAAMGRHAGGSESTRRKRPAPEKLFSLDRSMLDAKVTALLVALAAVFLFAYWPTLVWIEHEWRTEPDYSHGYLVIPLAALLCWHRRDMFPGIRPTLSWAGLSLMGLAVVMRIVGRFAFADFLDAWSILPMLAGAIWLLFGPAAMRWSLPAIAFLFLMFPLPYRAESLLSWKLQGVATQLSTVFLRVIGLPAVSEGHVIWIGDQRLLVEQACSGLRIFVGVAALAFFWAAMVRRSWIDRVVLLVAAIPLAIFVNAVRITTVGILYKWFDSPAARSTIHDVSGYLMIPFAFLLLWAFKSYWEQLYRPREKISARHFVREPA